MAGDRQAPSGSPFDPSPQFWIHKVERNEPLTVIGRCWFAPVAAGMTFNAVASRRTGTWELDQCWLQVEEIHAYGHLLDELDQTVSARLVLSGALPSGLASESVLVARNYPSAHWERQDALWLRKQQLGTKLLILAARWPTTHGTIPAWAS
jgi:hypothetical protein